MSFFSNFGGSMLGGMGLGGLLGGGGGGGGGKKAKQAAAAAQNASNDTYTGPGGNAYGAAGEGVVQYKTKGIPGMQYGNSTIQHEHMHDNDNAGGNSAAGSGIPAGSTATGSGPTPPGASSGGRQPKQNFVKSLSRGGSSSLFAGLRNQLSRFGNVPQTPAGPGATG